MLRRCVSETQGLTLATSAFEVLYGGQLIRSTQLIKPIFVVFVWPTALVFSSRLSNSAESAWEVVLSLFFALSPAVKEFQVSSILDLI